MAVPHDVKTTTKKYRTTIDGEWNSEILPVTDEEIAELPNDC